MKDFEKRTILIAEDDGLIGSLLQGQLAAEGLDVSLVENGARALEVIESTGVDVLITDLEMPEKDGLTLIKEIRHNEASSGGGLRLPIVLLTGGDDSTRLLALRAGASHAFAKPFGAKLISWLRAYIRDANPTDTLCLHLALPEC